MDFWDFGLVYEGVGCCLVGRGRFETCPYGFDLVSCVGGASPAHIASLVRAPLRCAKGAGVNCFGLLALVVWLVGHPPLTSLRSFAPPYAARRGRFGLYPYSAIAQYFGVD